MIQRCMGPDAAQQVVPLEFTGERMVPEDSDSDTFWEHIFRYRFATGFVRNRSVVDIACGEGYGCAALLRARASSAIGIDVSQEACEHAARKYGIDARVGDAMSIPLADHSRDVIVSFETIEHVAQPERFIQECARVLKEDGQLVISTPDKGVYGKEGLENPFHCSEMTPATFESMLLACFRRVRLYSQVIESAPWWLPRSLVARSTPWRKLRGYWRLRRRLGGKRWDDLAETARRDPVNTICGPLSGEHNCFNPYLVRRRSRLGHEASMYVIAVADRG